MSRPYQFADESTTQSPLDRQQPNPFPSGQPPSFKTNVNRAKTKRWVEAKSYSYDGDDWGDYDDADEYGAGRAAESSPPPPPLPTGLRQQGQGLGQGHGPRRSFTSPTGSLENPQGPPGIARMRSFDHGEEQRTFSTGSYPVPPLPQSDPKQAPAANTPSPAQAPLHVDTTAASASHAPVHSGSRSASLAQSAISDTPSSINPEHRRDFSPSAMVPPLRPSPSPTVPRGVVDSPVQARSGDSPTPSQRVGTPSNAAKPLPFIRPADIYRRMEEERAKERASMDSERRSMDSSAARPTDDRSGSPAASKGPRERTSYDSLGRSPARQPHLGGINETPGAVATSSDRSESVPRRAGPPLEPVEERPSESLQESNTEASSGPSYQIGAQAVGAAAAGAATQLASTATAPAASGTSSSFSLPQWEDPGSNFSDEFWSSSGWNRRSMQQSPPAGQVEQSQIPESRGPNPPLDVRSAVDTAFTAAEPQSAAGTEPSRSNTVSTVEISPITSKVPVPSDSYHPAEMTIPEDAPAEAQALLSQQSDATPDAPNAPQLSTTATAILAAPAVGSKQESVEVVPGYRRDLNTPSPNNSPAKSPALAPVEPAKPNEAEVVVSNPVQASTVEAQAPSGLDINKPLPVPDLSVPRLGASVPTSPAKGSQSNSRSASPTKGSQPNSRSASPTKSRVRDLADQYNKRDSVSTIDSWERPGSRPESRSGAAPGQSDAAADAGRPRVPGAWMSYTTNQSSSRENLSSDPAVPPESAKPLPVPEGSSDAAEASKPSVTDSTPVVHEQEATQTSRDEGPAATLVATGAAIGTAALSAIGVIGLGKTTSNEQRSLPSTDRSTSNSSPATHAKDGDVPSKNDQLADEVVQRLNSIGSQEDASDACAPVSSTSAQNLLDPSSADLTQAANRDSSVLPSEYDSYWATGPSVPSTAPEPQTLPIAVPSQETPPPPEVPAKDAPTASGSRPPLLDKRFSWEQSLEEPPAATLAVSPLSGNSAAPLAPLEGVTPLDSNDSIQPTPNSAFIPPSGQKEGASQSPAGECVHADGEKVGEPHAELRDVSEVKAAESSQGDSDNEKEAVPAAQASDAQPTDRSSDQTPAIIPTQATASRNSAGTATPPTFREILAIKSTPERIQTYDVTREQFASTDTGLGTWLQHVVATNPEHRNLANEISLATAQQVTGSLNDPLPAPPSIGQRAHTRATSLSRFGLGSLASGAQGPGPQAPTATSTFSATRRTSNLVSPSGPDSSGHGESKPQQIGKELLHTAGILGGKATHGAKGLLAKGKSRFRHSGEKTSSSPSRSSPGTADGHQVGTPSTWSLRSGHGGQASIHAPVPSMPPMPLSPGVYGDSPRPTPPTADPVESRPVSPLQASESHTRSASLQVAPAPGGAPQGPPSVSPIQQAAQPFPQGPPPTDRPAPAIHIQPSPSSSFSNILSPIKNRRRSTVQPSEPDSRSHSETHSIGETKDKRRSGRWDIGNLLRKNRSSRASSVNSFGSRPSSVAYEPTEPHPLSPLAETAGFPGQNPGPFTSLPPKHAPQAPAPTVPPPQQAVKSSASSTNFQIPQWQQPAADPTQVLQEIPSGVSSTNPPIEHGPAAESAAPSRRHSTMAMTAAGAAAPKAADVAMWDEPPPRTPTAAEQAAAAAKRGDDALSPPAARASIGAIEQLGVLPSPARSTYKRESNGPPEGATTVGDGSPLRARDWTGVTASDAPGPETPEASENVREKRLLDSVVRNSRGYIFEGIDVERLRKVQKEVEEEREKELKAEKQEVEGVQAHAAEVGEPVVEVSKSQDESDIVTPTGLSPQSEGLQASAGSENDGGPVEQIVVAPPARVYEDDLVTPRAAVVPDAHKQAAAGAVPEESPDHRDLSRASTAATWEKDDSSDAVSWDAVEKHRALQPSDSESTTGAESSDFEKTMELETSGQTRGFNAGQARLGAAAPEPRPEPKWREITDFSSTLKEVDTSVGQATGPSEMTPTTAVNETPTQRLEPPAEIPSPARQEDTSAIRPISTVSANIPKDDRPRDTSILEPPVSPVRSSFVEQEYPSAPPRERPMSFVQIPRTGGVPQDVISVGGQSGLPVDSVAEEPAKAMPAAPEQANQQQAGQPVPSSISQAPSVPQQPRGPALRMFPNVEPPPGQDPGTSMSPTTRYYQNVAAVNRNQPVPGQQPQGNIRQQPFPPNAADPSQENRAPAPNASEATKPAQKSRFSKQLFKSKGQNKPPPITLTKAPQAAPQQPMTPTARPQSHQAHAAGADGGDALRRAWQQGTPNPRPPSVGADSVFSKADSTFVQASQSPTRTINQSIVGGIPPLERPQAPVDQKTAKKLQRASTGTDQPKKNRFSALGSIFGRTESTPSSGTPLFSKKLSKGKAASPATVRPSAAGPAPPAGGDSTAYREAMHAYQSQHAADQPPVSGQIMSLPGRPPVIHEDTGIPPPPGGYYGPNSWNRDHDPNGAGSQQPVVTEKGRPVNIQQQAPYTAQQFGSSPAPYGDSTLPYSPQSVSSVSPLSHPSMGHRTSSAASYVGHPNEYFNSFYNTGGSPSPSGQPQAPLPGSQNWQNPAMGEYGRMGSIHETPGQRQERPWNISLPPGVEETDDERAHGRRLSQEVIAARMGLRYRRVSEQGQFPPQAYTPAQLAQMTQMQQYQQYQHQQYLMQQQQLHQQRQRHYAQPGAPSGYPQMYPPRQMGHSQPPTSQSIGHHPQPPQAPHLQPSQMPPQSQMPPHTQVLPRSQPHQSLPPHPTGPQSDTQPAPQQVLHRSQSLPQQPHGFVIPQPPPQNVLPRSTSHAQPPSHGFQPPPQPFFPQHPGPGQPPQMPQASPPESEKPLPQPPPPIDTSVGSPSVSPPSAPAAASVAHPSNPSVPSPAAPSNPPSTSAQAPPAHSPQESDPSGTAADSQSPVKTNGHPLGTATTVAAVAAVGSAGAVAGASGGDNDDEAPVMLGVSYPGMEWIPQWTED